MEILTLQPSAVAAFDGIAERYDEVFTNSSIGRAQRDVVWEEIERVFSPGSRLLEINCGTGEDALFLAQKGMEVVALDQSRGMIEIATQRRRRVPGADVSFAVLDTDALGTLLPIKKFQGALSNFGGLNCVPDLSRAAQDLAVLLELGAPLLLCMLGPCCLWEVCWYALHAQWKKAFRRFGRTPVQARVADGPPFEVRYHSAAAVELAFWPFFRLKSWRGVGIAVPPSYLERWAARFPKILRALVRLDHCWSGWLGIRAMADHSLLVFERV